MDIDCFMLADGAQAVNGKLYVLGGGWNIMGVMAFPVQQHVGIAVEIRVGWQETERHSMSVQVLTDDGVLSQEIINANFETGRPPGLRPGTDQLVPIGIDCMLNLTSAGNYIATLNVDGTEMGRVPFQVFQLNMPQLPAQPASP